MGLESKSEIKQDDRQADQPVGILGVGIYLESVFVQDGSGRRSVLIAGRGVLALVTGTESSRRPVL